MVAAVDPSLRGDKPFPFLTDWRSDAALFAQDGLAARRYENDECAAAFFDAAAQLSFPSWEHRMLHPAVFAFLAHEPDQWVWPDLIGEVERDGGSELCGAVALWTEPGVRFRRLLRSLGEGSRRESCETADFVPCESHKFEQARKAIQQASAIINDLAPGFAADMASTVHAVALCDEGTSFRGSSGVIHRGLVFLSPDPSWSIGVFAEEIVHETTHNLLDMLSLRTPLLVGDEVFAEVHAAPFRPEPRHLYGNFHALVVVARLICLFDAFERHAVEPDCDWLERGRGYAHRSVSALEQLTAFDGLSSTARTLLDEFVAPVLASALR